MSTATTSSGELGAAWAGRGRGPGCRGRQGPGTDAQAPLLGGPFPRLQRHAHEVGPGLIDLLPRHSTDRVARVDVVDLIEGLAVPTDAVVDGEGVGVEPDARVLLEPGIHAGADFIAVHLSQGRPPSRLGRPSLESVERFSRMGPVTTVP